jgi:hypothetical protein
VSTSRPDKEITTMTPAQRAAARLNSKGRRIQAQRRAEFRQLRIEPNVRLRPFEIAAIADEAIADEFDAFAHVPLLDPNPNEIAELGVFA